MRLSFTRGRTSDPNERIEDCEALDLVYPLIVDTCSQPLLQGDGIGL